MKLDVVGEYRLVLGVSLPARGAWIEIVKKITTADAARVAPREGSVD